jgi:hypothetical protein
MLLPTAGKSAYTHKLLILYNDFLVALTGAIFLFFFFKETFAIMAGKL